MPTEPLYCATCRTAVNVLRRSGDVIEYFHGHAGSFDHKPVPVPLSQLPNPVMFCDFCNEPDPRFYFDMAMVGTTNKVGVVETFRVRDVQDQGPAARAMKTQSTGPQFTQSLGERWAACGGCADLIEKRDVLELVARVVPSLPRNSHNTMRKLISLRARLTTVYEALFTQIGPRMEVSHGPVVSGDGQR